MVGFRYFSGVAVCLTASIFCLLQAAAPIPRYDELSVQSGMADVTSVMDWSRKGSHWNTRIAFHDGSVYTITDDVLGGRDLSCRFHPNRETTVWKDRNSNVWQISHAGEYLLSYDQARNAAQLRKKTAPWVAIVMACTGFIITCGFWFKGQSW